jgi:hypothetical protein
MDAVSRSRFNLLISLECEQLEELMSSQNFPHMTHDFALEQIAAAEVLLKCCRPQGDKVSLPTLNYENAKNY